MKLLHTSDWHVGKSLRGRDRSLEHQAVLGEIVAIAEREAVELVVVAGDLFDSSAPSPAAERIVYSALMDLVATGAHVAVITGNHDNPRRFQALAPLFAVADRVHLVTEVLRPDDGGVRTITTASGAPVCLALLPFVSKRGIVRSQELWEAEAYEHGQLYQQAMAAIIAAFARSFSPDTINVLSLHAFVTGAVTGGGERTAHLLDDYLVPTQALPASANYIALGHIHRPQKVASGSPAHYCGSPLQMDFGETDQTKQVNIVELAPGVPAKVTPVVLTSGWPLVTITGTLDGLAALSADLDPEAWYRVRVDEARKAGLADEVREVLGPAGAQVVEVSVIGADAPTRRAARHVANASPHELFAAYLADEGYSDERLLAAFDALYEAEQ